MPCGRVALLSRRRFHAERPAFGGSHSAGRVDGFTVALTPGRRNVRLLSFPAHGGFYIVASLVWMCVVERTLLPVTDYIGEAVCVAGTGIILYGITQTTRDILVTIHRSLQMRS
ncbi:MAG TPA: hypothetical protein VM053_07525 [Gemmatimonadaceae bacterium]|nr:hypothetical protein [Gemmatimonadaceae bacterium]